MAGRTVLTLIRHGETRANREGVWHGSIDTPLSERGRRQAERVADYLARGHADAAALYSSPLQRARHTAEPIAEVLGIELRVDADLSEYHLGSWEGETYRDLQHERRLWQHIREDPDFAPHGGESPRQVAERLSGALRRIAAAHPGERVVIVAHGGALAIGLALLLDGDTREWRRVVANASVSELVFAPGPDLISFNHVGHLDGV